MRGSYVAVIVAADDVIELRHVRFGSKADMIRWPRNVRFGSTADMAFDHRERVMGMALARLPLMQRLEQWLVNAIEILGQARESLEAHRGSATEHSHSSITDSTATCMF
jgi:hypothetical protein